MSLNSYIKEYIIDQVTCNYQGFGGDFHPKCCEKAEKHIDWLVLPECYWPNGGEWAMITAGFIGDTECPNSKKVEWCPFCGTKLPVGFF